MTQNEICELAHEYGFAEIGFCNMEPFSEWRRTLPGAHKAAHGSDNDPLELLPWAKTLIVAVYPYAFYSAYDGARVSAYYVAIQRARAAGQQLTQALNERGIRAQTDLSLPHKSAANRAGIGRYGRNGLIQTPEHGSRICLRLIAIDMECEYGTPITCNPPGQDCGSCHLCEQNCPTRAIKDGYLDPAKCLRGLMMQGPEVPLQYRDNMGDKLLGCEICMRACPRNRGEQLEATPEILALADVERVINADTREQYIEKYGAALGYNYAITNRVLSQALLVAANLNHASLLPLIEPLREHPSAAVREHAVWAVEKLSGRQTPIEAAQQLKKPSLFSKLKRDK